MSSSNEDVDKLFGDLNKKFELLKAKEDSNFLNEALTEFCRGFDSPVIGSLAYLQQNTQTHRKIRCIATCDQLNEKTIGEDRLSFNNFSDELLKLIPPAYINFTFMLSDSIYPIGEVSETFKVYFSKTGYEIEYLYGGDKEYRLPKEYKSHLSPDEVRELRDFISASITKKASQKIDNYFESN